MLVIIHMVQLFFSFRHCITSHLYDSISSNSVFDFSPIIPHGAVSKLGTLQSFSLWFLHYKIAVSAILFMIRCMHVQFVGSQLHFSRNSPLHSRFQSGWSEGAAQGGSWRIACVAVPI